MARRDFNRDLSSLPPPSEFFVLDEVAGRWRRAKLTTQRLLEKFGVPVYRLTAKTFLYRKSDIERIEEQALHRPKVVVGSVFKPGVVSNPKQSKPKAVTP